MLWRSLSGKLDGLVRDFSDERSPETLCGKTMIIIALFQMYAESNCYIEGL